MEATPEENLESFLISTGLPRSCVLDYEFKLDDSV